MDENDTQYEMMEQSMTGEVPQWVSLRTKRQHQRPKSYVRIVGTSDLVQGRKKWDHYRRVKAERGTVNWEEHF